jgi:hypothetical protein
MTHVLALEKGNGAIFIFTSPQPWPFGPTPTKNGATVEPDAYEVLSPTTVRFRVAPLMGSVIGFWIAS